MNANKIIGYIGIFLILVFATAATKNFLVDSFNTDNNYNPEDNKVYAGNGEIQKVDLSVKDYNYFPQVINLKYNVPAEIVVDTSKVKGCLQSIVIPGFNVRKHVTPADNVIKFLPNTKGEFGFSCSMGMGFGKIVVN